MLFVGKSNSSECWSSAGLSRQHSPRHSRTLRSRNSRRSIATARGLSDALKIPLILVRPAATGKSPRHWDGALERVRTAGINRFQRPECSVSDCSAPASTAECPAWHEARATRRRDPAGRDRKRDRDIASVRQSASRVIPVRMHTATIRTRDDLQSKRTPLEGRR